MARARLRDRHQENLKKKLNILIAVQGVSKNDHENPDKLELQPENPEMEVPTTSSTMKSEDSQSE